MIPADKRTFRTSELGGGKQTFQLHLRLKLLAVFTAALAVGG